MMGDEARVTVSVGVYLHGGFISSVGLRSGLSASYYSFSTPIAEKL